MIYSKMTSSFKASIKKKKCGHCWAKSCRSEIFKERETIVLQYTCTKCNKYTQRTYYVSYNKTYREPTSCHSYIQLKKTHLVGFNLSDLGAKLHTCTYNQNIRFILVMWPVLTT